jgi:hypothetical protein
MTFAALLVGWMARKRGLHLLEARLSTVLGSTAVSAMFAFDSSTLLRQSLN